MDTTVTKGRDFDRQPGAHMGPALFVAHHPDSNWIGSYRRVEWDDPMVLGRRGSSLWQGVCETPQISRRHAEVATQDGVLVARDLDSRNGTLLNGQPLLAPTVIEAGDVLSVGEVVFVIADVPLSYQPPRDPLLLGISWPMAQVLDSIHQVAVRETTVLVLGEPGVGKELVAARLHDLSGRPGRLVSVNCGGVADGVLQSELFGHEKGAFTGAVSRHKGLVEEARGGTLFLDEIGDASSNLQATMLRLLQEKQVRKVGGTRQARVDVRFVCATNKDLGDAVSSGEFRLDLLTRLERWVIAVPPLRERKVDIPILARAFAARHAGREVDLSQELVEQLLLHRWPGNVRELDAVMERVVVGAGGADILPAPQQLGLWLSRARKRAKESLHPARTPAPAKVRRAGGRPVRPSRAELEQRLIDSQCHMSNLAKELGVGRSTLYRWIQELGIDLDALRN